MIVQEARHLAVMQVSDTIIDFSSELTDASQAVGTSSTLTMPIAR